MERDPQPFHPDDQAEQQRAGQEAHSATARRSRHHDPVYPKYRAWRGERRRPWYSKGWVWLIAAALGVLVIALALGQVGNAVRSVAEVTGEQTEAMREQTDVIREQTEAIREEADRLREQGRNLEALMQEIRLAIQSMGDQIQEAIQSLSQDLQETIRSWAAWFQGQAPEPQPSE